MSKTWTHNLKRKDISTVDANPFNSEDIATQTDQVEIKKIRLSTECQDVVSLKFA